MEATIMRLTSKLSISVFSLAVMGTASAITCGGTAVSGEYYYYCGLAPKHTIVDFVKDQDPSASADGKAVGEMKEQAKKVDEYKAKQTVEDKALQDFRKSVLTGGITSHHGIVSTSAIETEFPKADSYKMTVISGTDTYIAAVCAESNNDPSVYWQPVSITYSASEGVTVGTINASNNSEYVAETSWFEIIASGSGTIQVEKVICAASTVGGGLPTLVKVQK